MDARQSRAITESSAPPLDEAGADDLSLDRQIQRALLVEPSPAFVARVRLAVGEARRPSGFGWGWRIGIAAVATSALLISATMRETSPSIAPGGDRPLTAASSPATEHVDPVGASGSPGREYVPRVARMRPVAPTVAAAHRPQVLIAPEERAGWRLLMAMLSDPQRPLQLDMDEPTLDPLTPSADVSTEPLLVEPIVVTQ
jgi:hypothetical protein